MIIDNTPVAPALGDKMWTVPIDEDRKVQLILAANQQTVFISFFNGTQITPIALSREATEALGLVLMTLDQELNPDAWTHWIDPNPGAGT